MKKVEKGHQNRKVTLVWGIREWKNSNNNATAYLNGIKVDFNNIIKLLCRVYTSNKNFKSSNQYFV